MSQRRRRIVASLVAGFVPTALPGAAVDGFAQRGEEEPLLDELIRHFKRKSLSVGALFQTVADFQVDRSLSGSNGFTISNMRLRISGELDGGFGYLFQTNFSTSPAILDAKAYFRFAPPLVLDVGLFKGPFSRELLTSAGSIDFVNRSQVVTALAPARQVGVQIGGALGPFVYGTGVFNGNAFDGSGNDSDELMYVARIAFLPQALQREGGSFEMALNAAYSEDQRAALPGLRGDFTGTRTLLGADVRWTRGRWLWSGEIIAGQLEPEPGPESDPFGFHQTGGLSRRPESSGPAPMGQLRPRRPPSRSGFPDIRTERVADLAHGDPGERRGADTGGRRQPPGAGQLSGRLLTIRELPFARRSRAE